MKIKITVEMDNAAFQEGEEGRVSGYELARQLRKLASLVEHEILLAGDEFAVRDINGNKTLIAQTEE